MPVTESTFACAICGNNEGNIEHHAREMMYGTREKFVYVECFRCKCLQLMDVPKDLSVYYPSDYYSLKDSNRRWTKQPFWRKCLRRQHALHERGHHNILGMIAGKRYPHWKTSPWLRRVPIDRDAAILEVGSGSGQCLHLLFEMGYHNLIGIDPYLDRDYEQAEGVVLKKCELAEMEGSYDYVLLSHVLEHMPEPLTQLRHIARLLKSQGTAAIAVPVSGCAAWAKYGVDWLGLDAPRHLFLHNATTMNLLAEQAGLIVEDSVYESGFWQLASSEGYARDIPLKEQDFDRFLSPADVHDLKAMAVRHNGNLGGENATFFMRLAA